MKNLFLLFSFLCCSYLSNAQLDIQCDGRDKHSIYLVNTGVGIYRIDSVDSHPTKPIKLENADYISGISINNNLDSIQGPETMYSVSESNYYSYWDGAKWVATNHSAGDAAVNIGGTDKYIFSMAGSYQDIYRYNGKGDAQLLISGAPTIVSVYDIATDKAGNFYIFYNSHGHIVMYDTSGIALDTLTTTGFPGDIQPGFTILGNRMYGLANDTNLYEGIVSNHNVSFTKIKTFSTPYQVNDIASCPEAAEVLSGVKNPAMPHFAMFPNPANDLVTVKLNNTDALIVYDCLGRRKISISTVGLSQYTFPVGDWPGGIYYVTAISSGGETTSRSLSVK